MDGIRLNDLESLEAFGVNKQKIVEEITRAYAHQIYVDGFFNGDPHPGTLSLSLYVCAPCAGANDVHMYGILIFLLKLYENILYTYNFSI